MPYFGICWARTLKKKSAPSNLSDFKVMQESNNAQIWNQNPLFAYFSARVSENYCHFEINTLKFV